MVMFRICCAVVLVLLSLSISSYSQDHGFGIGMIVGEPTGISIKGWLNATSAVDGGLAWSFVKGSSFHIHADYLLHSFDVFKSTERIPLYYGIGGRIKVSNSGQSRLGARGVIGLGYIFSTAPIDLFFEVAPILELAPETDLSINAGLGARFYFK